MTAFLQHQERPERGRREARVFPSRPDGAILLLEHESAEFVQQQQILALGIMCAAERKDLRSEEHTSELQSLTNLVCRLLLEKKKISRQLHARIRETRYMHKQR